MEIKHCVICGALIHPIHQDENTKPEQGMWSGGIVDKITANYGSIFDESSFIIAVCDECILYKGNGIKSAD